MRSPESHADGSGHGGRVDSYTTDEELGCTECEFFGRMPAETDTLAGVTAIRCPKCGHLDEPDGFERPA